MVRLQGENKVLGVGGVFSIGPKKHEALKKYW